MGPKGLTLQAAPGPEVFELEKLNTLGLIGERRLSDLDALQKSS